MERSTKSTLHRAALCAARPPARGGKITLVTIFAILGLVVVAGFVGNAGHVVTAKVNTQNAADAIAFSSAQWMARGMNAVTATNHLIGEMTGLVVAIEAIGGPEADERLEDYPLESSALDKMNRTLKSSAPIRGGYGASAFTGLDEKYLKFVVDFVSPESQQKAKHRAFATVYDSKIVLKRDLRKRLLIKTVANLGFLVPPPFGYATAIAAYAAHADSSIEIAKIIKEYIILEGLELVAVHVRPIKVGLLEEQLIPALAAHGDFLAGRQIKSSPIKAGVVNAGITDTFQRLGEVYGIQAAMFPGPMSFRLPITTEPEPSNIGSKGKNEPEWGSDDPPKERPEDFLGKIKEGVDDQKDRIEFRIRQLEQSIDGRYQPMDPNTLVRMEDTIDDLLDSNPNDQDRARLTEELNQIRALRVKKQKRIKELEEKLAELDREIAKTEKLVKEMASTVTKPGNMSIRDIPQDKLNQAEERYTQWVRATYPNVDAFRAAVVAQFDSHLEKSEASKHYRKWTERYTLVKSWQFRSGYRFRRVDKSRGQWQKVPKVKPLRMYVMKGTYEEGQRRDRKGHEPWTLATNEAKREAEQMFTVIGITHRELEPLFSPVLYPVASKRGMTTFAQAVYYNANEQKPEAQKSKLLAQAKVGWDTLNWDPATTTPEWGAGKATSHAKWPWEIFTEPIPAGSAAVKLNWQAKLMPVTKSRLIEAAAPGILESRDMATNIGAAALVYDKMVTH